MKADATDPTGSQSTERTSDPSERKHSTTQTTKLEDFIHLIGDGWCTEFYELARKDADTENTQSAVNLMNLIERCETDIRKEITALIQSEASRIALEAIGEDVDKDKPPFNQHDFGFMSANAINNRLREQRTKLKALTAPEGGKAR